MAGSITVTISGLNRSAADLGLTSATDDKIAVAMRLRSLFNSVVNGSADNASPSISILTSTANAVRASATATLVSAVATNAVTINGVAITAVASGATADQWNIGADDTASAANLAAAINASTTAKVAGYVFATSAGTVVTVSAITPGVAGNAFTFTKTGAPITVTGSGFLAGGTGGNVVGATAQF